MAFLVWDSELSVGIYKIDEQHKTLLTLINQLHEGMRSGNNKEQLRKTLIGLKEYAELHFSMEEDLMTQHGFPDIKDHQVQHNKFIKKILDFEIEFDEGSILLSMEVVQYLRNWYLSHVKGMDQEYADFFREKGLSFTS